MREAKWQSGLIIQDVWIGALPSLATNNKKMNNRGIHTQIITIGCQERQLKERLYDYYGI